MFWGLDDPDERYSAGGNCALGIAADELLDERDLVRDSDTSGEEKDGAVGVKGVGASVWAFGEGCEADFKVGRLFGALVEFVGEACPAADEEGDGRLLEPDHVLLCHGDFLVRKVFFGAAPGNGEWVCRP